MRYQQSTRTITDRLETQCTDCKPDHTQYSTPKYGPDGQWIAVSMWTQDSDLWILDKEGTYIRQLTNDMTSKIVGVRWTDTLFSSDRTGIYNIFAIDLEGNTVPSHQCTDWCLYTEYTPNQQFHAIHGLSSLGIRHRNHATQSRSMVEPRSIATTV